VRKDGTQLRITAQLINARTGVHMWSQTYDRKLESVFSVQEDIAKDVARALSIALDVGDMSRAKCGTNNLDAYDKYLRARDFFNQGGAAAGGTISASRWVRMISSVNEGRRYFFVPWRLRISSIPPAKQNASSAISSCRPSRISRHVRSASVASTWVPGRCVYGSATKNSWVK